MDSGRLKRALLFAAALAGITLMGLAFAERAAAWVFMSLAIVICAAAFAGFERRSPTSGDIAAAAVMTALSVAGRIAFAPAPAFKPCAAVIILSGMYLGAGQGFMVGALTALVSNFYFSQGMWTPFQMLTWGAIGLLAGALGGALRKNKAVLCIYGALAGIAFSVLMDLWSCLWTDGSIGLERFLALTAASGWFAVGYAVSNTVFLWLFANAAERIFGRLRDKYGIGSDGN